MVKQTRRRYDFNHNQKVDNDDDDDDKKLFIYLILFFSIFHFVID